MSDPQDMIELGGRKVKPEERPASAIPQKFLSVHFRCCHVYGRMYRNAEGTRYEGRCPRCGAKVEAGIGPGGTSRRMFEAG